MKNKILEEVFGITDELQPGGSRPGNLTYDRDRTSTNNTTINPFEYRYSQRANLPGLFTRCTFYIENGNKCSVGCNSIKVSKNTTCPIYTVYIANNQPPLWQQCPCSYVSNDVNNGSLYGRLTQNENDIKNTYDFNREDANNKFDLKKPLTGWQYDIYDELKKRQKNLIISVPPGGGKTRPIKAYFYEKMLMFLFNRGGEMPRFMYFVPTKQLSIQIAFNDFIRDDEYGIMALLGNLQNYKGGRFATPNNNFAAERETVKNWFHELLYREFQTEFEREQFLLKLSQSFIAIKSGDNPNPNYQFEPDIVSKLPFLRGKDKPIIICVKDKKISLIDTVSKFIGNCDHIIVDELQELLNKPEMPTSTDTAEVFANLCRVIKLAGSRKTPIHLLTGSVNEDSLLQLSEAFNKYLKVYFEFIPNIYRKVPIRDRDPKNPKRGGERHLDASTEMPNMKNRSKLTVVPLQALSGENSFDNQIKLIKDIVRTRQTNSIMVIFSVRNFAKTSIINLILEATKTLPPRNVNLLYDSPSRISIALNSNTFNQRYRNSQRLSQNEQYTVVGVGGAVQSDTSRIVAQREANKDIRRYDDYNVNHNNYISPEDREKIRSHDLEIAGMLNQRRTNTDPLNDEKSKKIYIDDIEFLKYFDRYELEKDGENKNVDNMTFTKDENNVLYRGVLAGIGLMIGSMHPIHKDTIQRLFQKGKIYLLLATDALGVKFAPSDRNI